MIHIVAILTAQPGQREALLTRFKAAVPAVQAEDGCLDYAPVIDLDSSPLKFGEDCVVVIEKWRDQAALDAHGKGAALQSFVADTKDVLAKLDVYLLQNA
ncbi:putative quinol monooxygenase [Acidisoma cladoniae]|uniref:putative quinol monooxygenase n=1 Tax=Acidisoma cladoniae TaxID=3040935 RepID=UPI00254CCD42|nr:putative quinol monooxygenase [Acidisoma sp. PAMC 29798]